MLRRPPLHSSVLQSLDEALRRGLPTGAITELVGVGVGWLVVAGWLPMGSLTDLGGGTVYTFQHKNAYHPYWHIGSSTINLTINYMSYVESPVESQTKPTSYYPNIYFFIYKE